MSPAFKNILQFGVQMCDFRVYRATLGEFQAFISVFRSMTKHGNSGVKPNLSLHNTYHLHHIRSTSKLPLLRSKG